jgi:hypothetical protein
MDQTMTDPATPIRSLQTCGETIWIAGICLDKNNAVVDEADFRR